MVKSVEKNLTKLINVTRLWMTMNVTLVFVPLYMTSVTGVIMYAVFFSLSPYVFLHRSFFFGHIVTFLLNQYLESKRWQDSCLIFEKLSKYLYHQTVSPAKLAASGEHTLGAPQCEKGIVLQHKERKRKESIPKFNQELWASVLSTSAGQGVKRTTVELCCRYSSLKYLFPTCQRRMTEVRRCCSNRSQSQR